MPKISARETVIAKPIIAMGRASTAKLENGFVSGRVGFLKPVGIAPQTANLFLKVEVVRYHRGYNDHKQLYGEQGFHPVLTPVIELFDRHYDGQSNEAGEQVADVGVLDVPEKVKPHQDEGAHTFKTRDFQSQEVLHLGGDNGEAGAGHKATEDRF